MRYVNLKKRNTTKLEYVSKRLATASMLCLALTAVIVLPLTSKASSLQAQNEQIIENIELGNDVVVDEVCFDDQL